MISGPVAVRLSRFFFHPRAWHAWELITRTPEEAYDAPWMPRGCHGCVLPYDAYSTRGTIPGVLSKAHKTELIPAALSYER